MKTKKYVALFDLDNTIYNAHSFFQVVKWAIDKGRVSADVWTKTEEVLGRYKKAELTYSDAANLLLDLFASSLKGQKYLDLYEDVEFFSSNRKNFYLYFEKVLPALREKYDIYLVTTNAQYVAEAVVKQFNLTGFISSELDVVDGLFTGKVTKSLANGKDVVGELIKKYDHAKSIAVGDSENDIGMIELVENPLCINPSFELKKYAEKKGWVVCTDESIADALLNILG